MVEIKPGKILKTNAHLYLNDTDEVRRAIDRDAQVLVKSIVDDVVTLEVDSLPKPRTARESLGFLGEPVEMYTLLHCHLLFALHNFSNS